LPAICGADLVSSSWALTLLNLRRLLVKLRGENFHSFLQLSPLLLVRFAALLTPHDDFSNLRSTSTKKSARRGGRF
jgi:hypothetical protein